MATVAQRIEELERPKKDTIALQLEVLRQLPQELPEPTLSNFSEKPFTPAGWLHFSKTASNDGYDALAILKSLQDAGWETAPATLVQRDSYRRSTVPGWTDEIPDELDRNRINDRLIICPLWIRMSNFDSYPSICCYMTAPSNSRTYQIMLDDPALRVSVNARRHEVKGGWYFERGTAKIHNPKGFQRIGTPEHIAGLSIHCGASVDTEHSINAVLYWKPLIHGQDQFPWSAADMLAVLRQAQEGN